MNTFLLRARPEGKDMLKAFRENGYVAIGWGKTGDLSDEEYEGIKTALAAKYAYEGRSLGNNSAMVNLFVNGMQSGDLLVVPDGDDIYLARVTAPYCYDAQAEFPHQHSVEWLQQVQRGQLSPGLRGSLQVPRTVVSLDMYGKEIEGLANLPSQAIGKAMMPIAVEYPLRPDFKIRFSLPADITKEEAGRLATYFSTLYFA